MILHFLEKPPTQEEGRLTPSEKEEVSFMIEKNYIQLIDLYIITDKGLEAQQSIDLLEARLEAKVDSPETFKMFNELANVLRKHSNMPLAISVYKKALLSVKARFKNDYLGFRDSSRILINIASTELIQENHVEALKYYQHAL